MTDPNKIEEVTEEIDNELVDMDEVADTEIEEVKPEDTDIEPVPEEEND